MIHWDLNVLIGLVSKLCITLCMCKGDITVLELVIYGDEKRVM